MLNIFETKKDRKIPNYSIVQFTVCYYEKGDFVSDDEASLFQGTDRWGQIPDGIEQKNEIKFYTGDYELKKRMETGVELEEPTFAIIDYRIFGQTKGTDADTALAREHCYIGNEIFQEHEAELLEMANCRVSSNCKWATFLTLWEVQYDEYTSWESVYPEYDTVINLLGEIDMSKIELILKD